MADIDSSNPLPPVAPQRPIRRVEENDRAKDERRRKKQEKRREKGNKNDNNDGGPHIDEYA
jgi:hypothetical protein